MRRLLWARTLLGAGGVLLGLAPFYPYTYIPAVSWQAPLYGFLLGGGILLLPGGALLLQALLGRGSLLWAGMAWAAAAGVIWRDIRVCTHDVGMALGRMQLSLQGINRYIIGAGLPPLHLIEAGDVHRPLAIGLYLALAGALLSLLGILLWLSAKGKRALFTPAARCSCGRCLEEAFRFCPECGRLAAGPEPRCERCGGLAEAGWTFCAHCGAALKPQSGEPPRSRAAD